MVKGEPTLREGGRNEVKNGTPYASGECARACDVPPGDVQVDTFALGGGDPSGSFFWILDGTDRKTQWTVLSPTWNRGRHATLESLGHVEGRFPFAITSLHSDNGGEILNHHVCAYLGGKPKRPFLRQSRPRRCNDNAHVEEKNRSAGRQPFGEVRQDCPALQDELVRPCDDCRTSGTSPAPARCSSGRGNATTGRDMRASTTRPGRRSSGSSTSTRSPRIGNPRSGRIGRG